MAFMRMASPADREAGPLHNDHCAAIIQTAARYRLPATHPFKDYAEEGGLLYCGSNQLDQWPRAADCVDRILSSAKPSNLPVQAPTKYELAINLKAAKHWGFRCHSRCSPPPMW